MKVFITVVDILTGISQNGMIEEQVSKGLEINNALKHFGLDYGYVTWLSNVKVSNSTIKTGLVDETSKIISIITV